jgi:hypothetical protein
MKPLTLAIALTLVACDSPALCPDQACMTQRLLMLQAVHLNEIQPPSYYNHYSTGLPTPACISYAGGVIPC